MLTAVLLGFLFPVFLALARRVRFPLGGKALSVLASLLPLGLFGYFLQFAGTIASGNIIYKRYEWAPSFGVGLDFTLDGISLIFSLLITGIGFLVFAYSAAYMKGHPYLDRFYAYLSLFMAAMLGLVLSDNLIALFVFWELTSVSSFFLIGFKNTDEDSRKSAITALGITAFGGLALLAGALLLGNVAGTFSIAGLTAAKGDILDNSLYPLIALMLFIAAFTKSAQFPFHFWLPGAMVAPTPVSTYLHSATMVKAGVYLLMRFTPVMGGEALWNTTLTAVGGITMVYAAWHTLFKTDLKGILAYSTIAALGMMVFLIGLGTQQALLAAAVFVLVHALYKGTLFLVTGAVDMKAGMRDVTKLSGLRKVLPLVAVAGFFAALSNAGIPPSFGFLGKDLIYDAALHGHDFGMWVIIAAVITKLLFIYAGFTVGVRPFAGKLTAKLEGAKKPLSMLIWMPPLLLATGGILFGLFPGLVESSLVKPAVSALGGDNDVHLQLWHGFNNVLLISGVTIVAGLLLYGLWKPSGNREKALSRFEVISPRNIIVSFTRGFWWVSGMWTSIFQSGYLRNYISVIVLFLVGVLGYTLLGHTRYAFDFQSFSELTVYEIVTLLVLFLSILMTISVRSRLAAVAAMGVLGYAICLIFVFYSAPDLAMTQFTIDTLTVILFVLVLYRLPRYQRFSSKRIRLRDGLLSVAFGALVFLLAIEVLAEPKNTETSEFFASNAYLLAKGKNIVNVILVDFRGIDTFMEISVLAISAIGVFALLKLRLSASEKYQ